MDVVSVFGVAPEPLPCFDPFVFDVFALFDALPVFDVPDGPAPVAGEVTSVFIRFAGGSGSAV